MNPIVYPKEARGRWYLSVDRDHRTVKETCSIFGISRETYYKWYRHDHGHWYNYERIHLGKYLNGLTPVEKLQQY